MNRNALGAVILFGGLWATAQAQVTAPSAALQDPAEAVKFYNNRELSKFETELAQKLADIFRR
jgi:hypothetical protein